MNNLKEEMITEFFRCGGAPGFAISARRNRKSNARRILRQFVSLHGTSLKHRKMAVRIFHELLWHPNYGPNPKEAGKFWT